MTMTHSQPVLAIDNLSLEFPAYKSSVKALNGVSLHVNPGEIVGVVGESGSGKSVTAMLSMRLLPERSYRITSGSLSMLNRDMLSAPEKDLLKIRGRDAAMIFQEPMTALNPTRRIGRQMLDVIIHHQKISAAAAHAKAVALLRDMHIASPEQVLESYPFELSGGMRQRVMIALAFSCEPQLLIADEPTTALDVTVQRQVLLLLREKARAKRHCHPVDHPRHGAGVAVLRPGVCDVHRRGGGTGPHRRCDEQPATPLHPGSAQRPAGDGRAGATAADHPRASTQPGTPAHRLHVRRTLRACHAGVR